MLPDHAPQAFLDRSTLWNDVERIEKAKNAQLAREVEFSLPRELSREQNIALARAFVQEQFVAKGMCADVCFHDTGNGNPHVHVMLTMRPIEPDGTWGSKQKKEYILDEQGERIYDKRKRQYKCRSIPSTDWNEQSKAEEWRSAWAEAVNVAMEQQGLSERIDHRSYERQGIEQIPTIHVGAASQMERKGMVTDRGSFNCQIEIDNRTLKQINARLKKLQSWLRTEAEMVQPTLKEILQGIIAKGGDQRHYQNIAKLKIASKVLIFVEKNGIEDVAGLVDKVADMRQQFGDIRERLKVVERRLKTLDEHLKQTEIIRKNRKLYQQYQQIQNSQKREAFYESHRAEMMLYEAASRYFEGVMNGKAGLPVKEWQNEAKRLSADRNGLYLGYQKIKEELQSAEAIKQSAESILREEAQSETRARSRGLER